MPSTFVSQANPAQTIPFLESVLNQQAEPGALAWLRQQREQIGHGSAVRKLYTAYSMASRHFDSSRLELSPEQLAAAAQIRTGFMPQYWSRQQTARTLLLLALPEQRQEQFVQTLDSLAETGDVAEQTALYAALPLLPHPLALDKRAAEGIRSNITAVFDAIALHNPYPADYLAEGPWNQMVVKAVFLNRPLYQIWGAEKRANPALAQMLHDFVHERWAAHRSFTPELWRFVVPYLQKEIPEDLEKVIREGSALEKEAVLLACAQSKQLAGRRLLDLHPKVGESIKAGKLNWISLGQRFHAL